MTLEEMFCDLYDKYGKDFNDDVLYVVRSGIGRDIYYMFHLTYSAHNADGFPRYVEFTDLFAVKEFIERSYIEDCM